VAVLTDFFVTTPEQATALARSGPNGRPVPMVLAKSVDPVKVATLHQLITGSSAPVDQVDEPVVTESESGPWLVAISAEVTGAIGALADDRLTSVGIAWAATDEWVLDGAASHELIPLVRDLRDLARRALPPARLYLWISL